MLEQIVAQKKIEVNTLRASLNVDNLVSKINKIDPKAVFASNIRRVAVIAEIKKASPVKGVLCEEFDPFGLARTYTENGAAVLSVITDCKFFQGSPAFIQQIRPYVELPILRKDFIIDELQIYETLMLGANMVLLIAVLHDYYELLNLTEKCQELGLEPLVEVHNRQELKKVLDLPIQIIGVNNRNLTDFTVDIKTSLELGEYIPESFIKVSESGIKSSVDMQTLEVHGFKAALIGEALVSSADPGGKLRELVNYDQG